MFRKKIDQKNFLLQQHITDCIRFRWSVKYFFAPNSTIFRKKCDREEEAEEDGERKLQSVMLFRQTQ